MTDEAGPRMDLVLRITKPTAIASSTVREITESVVEYS